MAGSTRRINHGAGHSYLIDGEPADGVTTVIGDGVPKPALIDAAARETADYAVNHWTDLADLDLAKRLRKIEKGRFEKWNAAKVRGTKVHSYAEQLIAGETVEVPDAYVAHVDQCLAFLADWTVVEVAVEATVINRQYRYAGTLDLLARFGTTPALWLLDWKTSASGVWPEAALQLAAYAHATSMLDGDGAEIPMPAVAGAAAVHLRADGYDVFPVDISDETFRVFLYAQQVAHFRGRPRIDTVGEPLSPDEALDLYWQERLGA
jgi:hypothetical protein